MQFLQILQHFLQTQFLFQNRGPSKFEDGYKGWVWEVMGEGGMPAATIYPVVPMWDKFAHHSLDAYGLGMAERSISSTG